MVIGTLLGGRSCWIAAQMPELLDAMMDSQLERVGTDTPRLSVAQ